MYRHFAVVTVAITACLAIFADGENRQALADTVHEKNQQQQMAAKERELVKSGKGGNSKREMIDKRRVKGSFGSDDVSDPGTISVGGGGDEDWDFAGSNVERGSYESPVRDGEIVIPAAPPPGMTTEEFEQMKRELMRRKRLGRG